MRQEALLSSALAIAFGLCAAQALAQAKPVEPKIASVSPFAGGVAVKSDQGSLWLVEGAGLDALDRLPEPLGEGPNVVALVCEVAASGPPQGCSTLPGKAGAAEVQKALALLPALTRSLTVPGVAGSPLVAVVAFGEAGGVIATAPAGQAACLTNACSTPARPLVRAAGPPPPGGENPLMEAMQAGAAAGKPFAQTLAEQGFRELESQTGDDGQVTRRFTDDNGRNMVFRGPPGVEPGFSPPGADSSDSSITIGRRIPAP